MFARIFGPKRTPEPTVTAPTVESIRQKTLNQKSADGLAAFGDVRPEPTVYDNGVVPPENWNDLIWDLDLPPYESLDETAKIAVINIVKSRGEL